MAQEANRFSRLPGSARNYFDNVQGKAVSRRERDRIVRENDRIAPREAYKPLVETDAEKFQRQQRVRSYKRLQSDWMARTGQTPREAMQDKQFQQMVADIRSKSPERRTRGLVQAGLRKGLPTWVKPGSSPKGWNRMSTAERTRVAAKLNRAHRKASK